MSVSGAAPTNASILGKLQARRMTITSRKITKYTKLTATRQQVTTALVFIRQKTCLCAFRRLACNLKNTTIQKDIRPELPLAHKFHTTQSPRTSMDLRRPILVPAYGTLQKVLASITSIWQRTPRLLSVSLRGWENQLRGTGLSPRMAMQGITLATITGTHIGITTILVTTTLATIAPRPNRTAHAPRMLKLRRCVAESTEGASSGPTRSFFSRHF
jgi:hypothetical protein